MMMSHLGVINECGLSPNLFFFLMSFAFCTSFQNMRNLKVFPLCN